MIGFGSAEFGFILFGWLFWGSSLVPRRLAAVAVVTGVFGIISILRISSGSSSPWWGSLSRGFLRAYQLLRAGDSGRTTAPSAG